MDKELIRMLLTPAEIEYGRLIGRGFHLQTIMERKKMSKRALDSALARARLKTSSNTNAQFVYKLAKAGVI